MIAYASNTGTLRNLAALEGANWRLLLTPSHPRMSYRFKFRFAIDNGAWSNYKQGRPFDSVAFEKLIEKYGSMADFVVIPDIVAGGIESFELSVSWLPRLKHIKKLLLPVQDGMTPSLVGPFLRTHPHIGLFLGGSTEFKLREMFGWGMVASSLGRHYHVGRVNTARRIQLCEEAGVTSFDGTSATRYSSTLPLLESSRQQPRLFNAHDTTGDYVLHGVCS